MFESPSPSKKHKKHKKHKHKKRHGGEEDIEGDLGTEYPGGVTTAAPEDGDEDIDVTSPAQPVIKLKIKLGGQTLATTSITKSIKEEVQETPDSIRPLDARASVKLEDSDSVGPLDMPAGVKLEDRADEVIWEEGLMKGEDVFLTKAKGVDTSDEEQAWLDALEAGTLDDNGEVKKAKDPSLLTARQRALIHGDHEENLLQLPSGYKSTELTEEQLQKRQLKATKRRQMAFEKQEKDKKQTLDRLLKKQETKMKGARGKGNRRNQAPSYRYTSNQTATFISIPQGFSFPFPAQHCKKLAAAALCGVTGCSNQKKYSCSKTGVPLCGLACYKTNLARLASPCVA